MVWPLTSKFVKELGQFCEKTPPNRQSQILISRLLKSKKMLSSKHRHVGCLSRDNGRQFWRIGLRFIFSQVYLEIKPRRPNLKVHFEVNQGESYSNSNKIWVRSAYNPLKIHAGIKCAPKNKFFLAYSSVAHQARLLLARWSLVTISCRLSLHPPLGSTGHPPLGLQYTGLAGLRDTYSRILGPASLEYQGYLL